MELLVELKCRVLSKGSGAMKDPGSSEKMNAPSGNAAGPVCQGPSSRKGHLCAAGKKRKARGEVCERNRFSYLILRRAVCIDFRNVRIESKQTGSGGTGACKGGRVI